jgi:two-component system sensor kinase FixL
MDMPSLVVPEVDRDQPAHLRSILATVPDGMVVIDAAGSILSFSATAERMFGFSESEVLGENVSTLMPSPDRERHDAYIERYLTTGERHIVGIGRVTTARRRDGSTFPIELAIGEAQTSQGRVFTGFIRDLTERRATERTLHDLQDELAYVSRVSAVGTLAAALAHELNQPLAAISNYMEGARDLVDSDDPGDRAMLREAMEQAAEQSVRAGQIIRRLRDFIARREGEMRVESLKTLVSEANALALVGAPANDVEVRVMLDPSCDAVLVDRIQVQQVLLNLIRNALDAMEGQAVRRLEIASKSLGDDMVQLTVVDCGTGLTPEIAATLFEPFRSSKSEGMGLGLSICRTLIEAHGGRIWVEPAVSGGAAFHITLKQVGSGQRIPLT